tara:strand:+ start:132061 stop:132378 length:318 start_codon:yes stop_codon:yes gene_type:complete
MQTVSRDLSSSRAIYLKAALLVFLGLFAATLLLLRAPQWDVALLLAICVWACCRAYYFAFYVIEHYVDTTYRFRGLIDFAAYVMNFRREENEPDKNPRRDDEGTK